MHELSTAVCTTCMNATTGSMFPLSSTLGFETDHSSSMETTSLPHASTSTVSVLPSVSRTFAHSPTLQSITTASIL